MPQKLFFAIFLAISLFLSPLVLAETQTESEYVLQLQGPTWNHSTLNVTINTAYNETWWNPAYINSTLRAINQWNDALNDFAANYSEFEYLSKISIVPEISNVTTEGYDMKIFWIEQFKNETCEAGLSRTTYNVFDIITDSEIALSALDCDGNILTEIDMQNVALHELGHSLGLGHANNSEDLMYFSYQLKSPVRAISTLDAYGVATVFRWMAYSSLFNSANQGPKIYNVTLPTTINYDFLLISQNNLPVQSPLDSFIVDLLQLITKTEILITISATAIAIAVSLILLRNRSRRRQTKEA
jgi:hypothetical protein